MDRLVFLLKLGFVISSLEFMLANCEKMDDALLVYFLRQVCLVSVFHRILTSPQDP
ncbi:hypothetical protein BCR33DRAFT_711548 [Rhizoclosmatium globosum]|uniref:Uncharacterized protein n=1 Tax=Rhizoclosmatium globosum TaxID=329046 RepID=A0A1Y2D1R0_9FUNG|nr:hypothetical protein BCR33DRAFT_711548 [Rhizoclosmatium globosum]|eukprot:ORY53212.1 hypothetical protein BCR33DRAFT_711548 [Rhizoclosmatium globosum]